MGRPKQHRIEQPNEPRFDALSDAVVGFIETGHTQKAAAALAGTTPETISRWIAKGKNEIASDNLNGKYAKFVTRLTAARGMAQSKMEHALFAAGIRGNVTAATTWLKARAGDDWSEKAIVRLEGNLGVALDLTGKSDEEIRSMIAEQLALAAAQMDDG